MIYLFIYIICLVLCGLALGLEEGEYTATAGRNFMILSIIPVLNVIPAATSIVVISRALAAFMFKRN